MAETGNTYQLEPKQDQRFYPCKAKAIIQQLFNERLKGSTYDSIKSPEVAEELTRNIRAKVKELKIPRYKIAVQVIFGQLKGQGLKIASKSLWDPNFDNWASYTYTNENIFCTGMVFGVYFQ